MQKLCTARFSSRPCTLVPWITLIHPYLCLLKPTSAVCEAPQCTHSVMHACVCAPGGRTLSAIRPRYCGSSSRGGAWRGLRLSSLLRALCVQCKSQQKISPIFKSAAARLFDFFLHFLNKNCSFYVFSSSDRKQPTASPHITPWFSVLLYEDLKKKGSLIQSDCVCVSYGGLCFWSVHASKHKLYLGSRAFVMCHSHAF